MSDLDLGVVGNSAIAALIDRRGRIVWSCFPRLDGDPVFHGLLGASLQGDEGVFEIDLQGYIRSERRYWPNTAILETILEAEDGSKVRIVDFVPRFKMYGRIFRPAMLMRSVEPLVGSPMIKVRIRPSYDYGRERPETTRGSNTIRYHLGNQVLRLTTDGSPGLIRDEVPFILERPLTLILGPDETLPEAPATLFGKFCENTADYWREWVRYLAIPFEWQDVVIRAAITLKLCAYEETGGIVAALTTSIPEYGASGRTWDYRYCWLRDASLTVRALFGLGFDDEAEAFVSWLLHSTRLTQPRLRVLYDVYGNAPARERELDHLGGYFGSRPVRVGNAADEQLQLDVHGEVVDAVAHFVRRGGRLDLETERMLVSFGDYVCRRWTEPDEGIWESRSGRRHHIHSLVLCWVALDNLLRLHDQGHLAGIPVERFARTRDRIRREVETRAWNPRLRAYVSELEGETVDASALLIAWYGFEPPDSERMRLTYARIREELGAGGGLLYRYRSADSPGEAAFGICSFWGAEYLALGGGSVEEAQDLLETLCGYANEVGLFGEEIDPVRRVAAGNFPQAFTHVGLVNAALTLSHRLRGRTPHHRGIPAADSEGGAAS